MEAHTFNASHAPSSFKQYTKVAYNFEIFLAKLVFVNESCSSIAPIR